MMQAITTKYICPTNKRGSRVKASCDRGAVIIEWDDALDSEKNHVAAAEALCRKFTDQDVKKYGSTTSMSWMRPRVHGGIENGKVAHVFVEGVK